MKRTPEADPNPAPPGSPLVIGIMRFAMELIAWGGLAWWGWKLANGGIAGFLLGGLFLVLAVAAWGIFAVPNDPSRNPDPPIGVPGWLRLIIEFAVIGLAAYGLWTSGARWLSETLLTLTGLTYVIAYDRLFWLIRQQGFRGPRAKEAA